MPRPMYVANWKMFHSLETAEQWLTWWTEHPLEGAPPESLVVVCPPAPLLFPMRALIEANRIEHLDLGAQDLHRAFKGAFTGEVSGVSLWSVGAEAVIIGHSERRTLCGETDEIVAAKMEQAYLCGLCPILCIGETADERDAGETEAVLERQLAGALAHITEGCLQNRQHDPAWPPFAVAYEPVWAIG
ncbi:MAG TPA: triose-phosphate isomerase, partial [bacterium]|nr:triose-phosphate isomerase [bacterium]